jgi:hypothetical protein
LESIYYVKTKVSVLEKKGEFCEKISDC